MTKHTLLVNGAAAGRNDPLGPNTELQNGQFRLQNVLGQGGFGITYRAHDLQLNRQVAIKEFYPQGCKREAEEVRPDSGFTDGSFAAAKKKFLEEARVLARFGDSGIVRVFSQFQENNTGYMVMEFLEGKTLAELIEVKGALPEKEALSYIQKVGEALTVVHKADIIHRDVKPENIMLCDDGRVVLIDFGLTKQEVSGSYGTRALTGTGTFGTDGYAPIEQYASDSTFAPPTDIYALGATLYCLLTAQVPISALKRAGGTSFLSVAERNSQIRPAVSKAVAKAMEIQAVQRFQRVGEFLDALKNQVVTPQPTVDPVVVKQLRDAQARAQTSIEDWRKALAAANQAEEVAEIEISLPARLTDGTDAAASQLQNADWSTTVAIEKEANSARAEILSAAKSKLQKELATHAETKKNAQLKVTTAKANLNKIKTEAAQERDKRIQSVETKTEKSFSILEILGTGIGIAVVGTIIGWIASFIIFIPFDIFFGDNKNPNGPLWLNIILWTLMGGPQGNRMRLAL